MEACGLRQKDHKRVWGLFITKETRENTFFTILLNITKQSWFKNLFKAHFHTREGNIILVWIMSFLSVKRRLMSTRHSNFTWEYMCCCLFTVNFHRKLQTIEAAERRDRGRTLKHTDIYHPTCDCYMDKQDICHKFRQAASVQRHIKDTWLRDGNRQAIPGLIKLEESQKHH